MSSDRLTAEQLDELERLFWNYKAEQIQSRWLLLRESLWLHKDSPIVAARENERLREALQNIADMANPTPPSPASGMAHRALAEQLRIPG